MIFESPIDIRALDLQLHERKATLEERHAEVMRALKYNAESVQPAFQKEFDAALKSGAVFGYTPHWIENLFVVSATNHFIESLRDRGDIKYVTENFKAALFDPTPNNWKTGIDGRRPRNSLDTETTTPGQDAIRATEVNRVLGITGQGVLVANLDSGVDGTHPAFASRWRGNFAPAGECWLDVLGAAPTPADASATGHGTHVMGTMVGRAISGSDTNTVGAAPNARWIACNAIGQAMTTEMDNDVITAYEWFIDPDRDPSTIDDVPDVIQNSWGVYEDNPGYAACFDYWNTVILNCEAAGPVIIWSAGNEGPDASTIRSPAVYSFNEYQIFSVGSVDATNYSAPYPIGGNSSRGPSQCTPALPDAIKPEISAPGESIYSSIPVSLGSYGLKSGTSMAGPHVAGVVALMREACPDCDYVTIKDAILNTAIDYGTAGNDNTYGYGFIDAYEAVLAVADFGTLDGIVDDGIDPIIGARITLTPNNHTTLTYAGGEYALSVPAGTYDIECSAFGYYPEIINSVSVFDGTTTTQNISLIAQPTGVLSGTVYSCEGGFAVGAYVVLVDQPVPYAITNESGFYSFTVPQGTYDMVAYGAGCGEHAVDGVVLGSATTQNFTLPEDVQYDCSNPDGGGYVACENGDAGGPTYAWLEIAPDANGPGTFTGITGDDAGATITIPFNFRFYDVNYTSVWVCSNGFLSFNGTATTYTNEALPSPNLGIGIAPFWDDLNPEGEEHISYYHRASQNAFIIEWRQIKHWNSTEIETFQIWLYDVATNPGPNGDSQFKIQYKDLTIMNSATVGISDGTDYTQYTFDGDNDPTSQGLQDQRVILFGSAAAAFGTLEGTVTEAGTEEIIEGVKVTRMGSQQTATTNESGFYTMTSIVGTYNIRFTKHGYTSELLTGVEIEDQMTTVLNAELTAVPTFTVFSEDFESGATGWTHTANDGWQDNWHLSTERASSGTHAYKCGSTGGGDYVNYCDALLTSPVIPALPEGAWMSFTMQIEAEVVSSTPGESWDGFIIELSENGGDFELIEPDPAYTYVIRSTSDGPFPNSPCYSGFVTTWTDYSIELSEYQGSDVQFRFRFGSDVSITEEGVYIDDVVIMGNADPMVAPENLTINKEEGTGDLVFRWTHPGSPEYILYSSTSPDGPFETLVGTSATKSLSIPQPEDEMLYYVVISSSGSSAMSVPSPAAKTTKQSSSK
ncbi:S8 family serine peptidase [bacterium]|nr:S8 family serine peptidase [bacterium]